MKKGFFAIALTAGTALVTAKVLSDRKSKKEQTKQDYDDVSIDFFNAQCKKSNSEISEQKYKDLLAEIYEKVKSRGEVEERLDELYAEVEDIVDEHFAIMGDIEKAGVSSLEDFIKNFPHKAYEHKRIGLNDYCYEEQAKESSDYLAEHYYQDLDNSERWYIDYVEMLRGDSSKVKQAFDQIRNHNIK